MSTTVKLYSLPLSNVKTFLFAFLFILGNILFPQLAHLIDVYKRQMLEITSTFPAGVIGTTAENLAAAAAGENEEWTELYPHFADVAEEEGFKEIATMYRMIAKAEAIHEERYLKLLQRVKEETVFSRNEKIEWQCRNCGYVHEGKKMCIRDRCLQRWEPHLPKRRAKCIPLP